MRVRSKQREIFLKQLASTRQRPTGFPRANGPSPLFEKQLSSMHIR
jgi:hypothetical protein